MLSQLLPPSLAAVHAAMVLLVEPVGLARRHDQAMHALAEFRVVLALRKEVGARAAVARLPGLAAVGGVKDAGRRNADPDLPVVLGVQNQRMQDQPGAARIPVRPRSDASAARRHAARSFPWSSLLNRPAGCTPA